MQQICSSRQNKNSRSQTLKDLKRKKSQKDYESEADPEAKSMISARSSSNFYNNNNL